MSKIVADVPEKVVEWAIRSGSVENEIDLFWSFKTNPGNLHPMQFTVNDIKIKKSQAEKDQKRRLYRKEYVKRPYVQNKIQARLNDPVLISKRKIYAEREDVKERKRILALRARAVRRKLKSEDPELYRNIINSIEQENQQ